MGNYSRGGLSILSLANVEPYVLKEGEEYLNETQKEHFRLILNGWRKYLESELKEGETGFSLRESSANLPDPADRASQEEALFMGVRNKDRQINLMRQIANTLQHLEAGEYGYCQKCGEDIGIKRLEASPTTKLCIECQKILEIKEKQQHFGP